MWWMKGGKRKETDNGNLGISLEEYRRQPRNTCNVSQIKQNLNLRAQVHNNVTKKHHLDTANGMRGEGYYHPDTGNATTSLQQLKKRKKN